MLTRIVSLLILFVRIAAACGLLLASAVCLGQPQQDALTRCLSALEIDARFSAVAGRLALGARADSTPEMRADASTPTGKQVKALADWIAARSECVQAEAATGNANYRPPLQSFRLEAESEIIEAAADLHDRHLTFGAYNRRRQQVEDELRRKVAALSQRIQSQRAAQEQADREARERQLVQRSLEEAERQASLAQQQTARAQQETEQARRAARRPAAGPGQPYPPYRMVRPRVAAPVPYASCFQLDGRIVCTYR